MAASNHGTRQRVRREIIKHLERRLAKENPTLPKHARKVAARNAAGKALREMIEKKEFPGLA